MESVSKPVPSGSLARGAAVITVASAVSRITGFARVVVVAGAMGTTFLSNTYQTANTAPNLLFELVAAGVLTSVFVPTFVEYLVKGESRDGWRAADVLTSVALVALLGLAIVLALGAPLVMRLLTLGVSDPALRASEVEVGATFLRLFAPQVVFYGAGMIMTGALHAHRRFALAAIAPILNNLVVIGVYLAYAAMRGAKPPSLAGLTSGEALVLGGGTTLGVVAMTVVLIPALRRLGWRYRWRFQPSHPAVKKATRLGMWALGYAGGYQAGLIVVLLLANKIEGGVAAYQWAYTFFFVPHALIAMPIFSVLFPAMAEHASLGQTGDYIKRLREGIDMLSFVLMPVAIFMVLQGDNIAHVTVEYGAMTESGATLVGRVISLFAVGLPAYSAFLVFTRAYYAVGDTRSPTLVNGATVVVASIAGAALFGLLPFGWAVPGLALGHSIGFVAGVIALARLLAARLRIAPREWISHAVTRSFVVGGLSLPAMVATTVLMPDGARGARTLNLLATALAGAIVYGTGMSLLNSPELRRLRSMTLARRT